RTRTWRSRASFAASAPSAACSKRWPACSPHGHRGHRARLSDMVEELGGGYQMFQRMTHFAWRACPAALALPLLLLLAAPAAIAQSEGAREAVKNNELEQRVLDIAHMF